MRRNAYSTGVVYSSKKETRGDTIIFKYVKDISREGGNKLFSRQFSISIASVTRNNRPELHQERLVRRLAKGKAKEH